MASSITLTGLTPREAIADALHRCILGIDSNNHPLFESSCLTTSEMLVTAGPINIKGWPAINAYFDRVFHLVTSHTITGERIEIRDGANAANMTCHAVAYHIRPEDALKPENMSYTASCLYDIDLVKGIGDGLWKIQRWDLKVLWTTGDRRIVHPDA